MPTLIVTGGAGFIGSALVRQLIADTAYDVVTVDALTYAGSLDALAAVIGNPRHRFLRADVNDAPEMQRLFAEARPAGVIHLAAESHVDRSIDAPAEFMRTNVMGTYALLQEALRYWRALPAAERERFRFVHVSTDEVFGSLGPTGAFVEESPYAPRSPYAASKAAADHLARAWHHTYGLPAIVTNCSNNYGPFQFPDKLIPATIQRALRGEPVAVYGDGLHVRDWLHVDDHARALRMVYERGQPGASYNIGAGAERANLDVARAICALVDALAPAAAAGRRDRQTLITFVPDRPGHDRRYAIDASRVRAELGWTPSRAFDAGLRDTVAWYLEHQHWCERVQAGVYRGERLGTPTPADASA